MVDRRQWVRADLQCLLCGRPLGRLAGSVQRDLLGVAAVSFSVFRPSDARKPLLRVRGSERFRCDKCGGNALIDQIECFTTYDDADDPPAAHRRGRRPGPMRHITDWRLIELGLAS